MKESPICKLDCPRFTNLAFGLILEVHTTNVPMRNHYWVYVIHGAGGATFVRCRLCIPGEFLYVQIYLALTSTSSTTGLSGNYLPSFGVTRPEIFQEYLGHGG